MVALIDSGYTGEFANQRCKGPCWTYPTGWTPKTAALRAKILAPMFPGVDFSRVEELAARYYVDVPATESSAGGYRDAPKSERRLILSGHADGGLLILPKPSAVAIKCIKKPTKGWPVHNLVMKYVMGVFADIHPSFKDWTDGKIGPEYERLLKCAEKILAYLERKTQGDVLILPFQAGALFAGYNVQSSRGHMEALKTHVPATDFMAFCRAISDPESFADGSLFMDCPGVERAPSADGDFYGASCFGFNGGRFRFSSASVGSCDPGSGSASLVLPALMFSE